jgi:predicted RecA/RadA family phage recombinase
MLNHRGTGERVEVRAAAPRLSGAAVVEQDFQGFAYTSAAQDARYAVCLLGEYEMPLLASAAVGDIVYIGLTDFRLARVANGSAAPTIGGNARVRPFAKVTRVPEAGVLEPATGLMWVMLLPQPVTTA